MSGEECTVAMVSGRFSERLGPGGYGCWQFKYRLLHGQRPKAKKCKQCTRLPIFLYFISFKTTSLQFPERKYKTRNRLGFKYINSELELKALLRALVQKKVSLLQGTSVFLRNEHDFSSPPTGVFSGISHCSCFWQRKDTRVRAVQTGF